jgi:SecD/SecF fusion protein
MKKHFSWKLIAIIAITLSLGFFNLSAETQKSILPFAPESFTKSKIHLGLDLQGGSQLDYKIDLRKVPEGDQQDIIDGVQEVIEKRVNSLGVAEPNIYRSEIAGENHIIVELAETATLSQDDVEKYLGADKKLAELTDDEKKLVSLEKAKATVGKTIQLEFKEEKDVIDPEEKEKIKENALTAFERIKNGEDFEVVAQEEKQAYPGKVKYENVPYTFESALNPTLIDTITDLDPGEFQGLIDVSGDFIINESGQAIVDSSFGIIRLDDVQETVKNEKEVDVSHILVAYQGAERAPEEVTRSQDEAYELVKEIQEKITNGEDFAVLTQEYSNDDSNKDTGGRLDVPVSGSGTYVSEFEEAALKFTKKGELSDIVKTNFGYHLIKAEEIREDITEKEYKYDLLSYSTAPDPWQETGLTGKHFVHADIDLDQFYQAFVTIQFNDEGGKLFEEVTGRNVGKKLAIFVGGELVSDPPTVNTKISGGSARITGDFTTDEAKTLARDLNTGAIPAPIVLTGEYTIGATLGQQALNQSLSAGMIGLFIVIVFMALFYRVSGLMADSALIVYATIFLFLIKSELHLGIALILSLLIFAYLIYKIVDNKDSGWEKTLSFLLTCLGFFFLTYLLKTGVVLTLAGIAGIILSIGMAVDANILIFERFKEELRTGKSYRSAVESGFNRAWSAIRDSNFSTLITCAILFYFGSSIIKGFAFNLAAGILVSMFTAITITKTLLQGFVGRKISENMKAFGTSPKYKEPRFKFIKNSKLWLGFSGTLIGISLIAIISFGLNLGIDFTGGTLLEFSFKEPVTKQELTDNLNEIAEEVNNGDIAMTEENLAKETTALEEVAEIPEPELALTQDPSTKIDLSSSQILESGENNYIVKTKYLSSEAHDALIAKMKDRLPEFTEPRFTTIGPVIGKTLLHKAIIAMIFALIMIIVYVAIAFRKVPKEVSPWRFGACAIAALAHDVIIITGVFVILGQFLNVEIDALFITAMLTVFGYSVNDTIVIFDRLRENLILEGHNGDLSQIADKSLNQSLTRSINTSLSTLFTLVAVLLFGSVSIFYFILALTLGTVIGTYSSMFVATPLLVKWNKRANK